MKVKVIAKTKIDLDIDEMEAFRILCKTLDMECVLDEDTEFIVKNDEEGELSLFVKEDDSEVFFDERGELFMALRNVAVNICPNVSFRGNSYIYNNDIRR